MKTLTVKELIKQLRRHPDHTPVYITTGQAKPLRVIEGDLRLHMFEDKVFLRAGKKLEATTDIPKHAYNEPQEATGATGAGDDYPVT